MSSNVKSSRENYCNLQEECAAKEGGLKVKYPVDLVV